MSYCNVFVQEIRAMAFKGCGVVQVIVLFLVMVGTALFILSHERVDEVMPCFFLVCSVSVMQVSIRSALEDDYRSGVLEQLLIQDLIPELVIFLKILSHWVCVALPLTLSSMLLDFVVLGNNVAHVFGLGLALSTGLLLVSFVSSVGHSLVLGGKGGLIVAQVLVFPIIIPVAVYFSLLLKGMNDALHLPLTVPLGLGMICLIPVSTIFVLFAVRFAVEQN